MTRIGVKVPLARARNAMRCSVFWRVHATVGRHPARRGWSADRPRQARYQRAKPHAGSVEREPLPAPLAARHLGVRSKVRGKKMRKYQIFDDEPETRETE